MPFKLTLGVKGLILSCAPAIDTPVIIIIYPVLVTAKMRCKISHLFSINAYAVMLIIFPSKDKLRVDLQKSSPE